MTQSALDAIPGIGQKRRTALLRAFGSMDRMKEASVEELSAPEGMTRKAAQAVWTYLQDEAKREAALTKTKDSDELFPTPKEVAVEKRMREKSQKTSGEQKEE